MNDGSWFCWVSARRATAIEYMCTKFGVGSSSRFPIRVQTNRPNYRQTYRQTNATDAIPMPAAMPAWVMTMNTIYEYFNSNSVLYASEDCSVQ